jgi:hydroxysqualene dehydroxylase
VILPTRPLGWMHGDAAGRALEAAGATVELGVRVESLDEVDADSVVVAVPPSEAARLLGEPDPGLEDSPIVSVHLLFDRPLLRYPLAALLNSDSHWVFDRGTLTGRLPDGGGQYLTVVSSGVPELMDIRGRELVDRIAGQLVERLGRAELLWSRVSREPQATLALRPGVVRPPLRTGHANVVRAGAWTDTGWPATMEGAVRSGLAAAREVHA